MTIASSTRPERPRISAPWAGIFHLLVLYFVWGSTYLAIRVAVGTEGGFQPFSLGAVRATIAGTILLAFCALRGRRLRPRRSELSVLIISGNLLWVGGNGLVLLAETQADSGYAALLFAAAPMWVAAVAAVVERRLPSLALAVSLLIGFAGVGVLSAPGAESRTEFFAVICLLGGGLCWALGLVLQQRRPVAMDAITSSGWQQLFAGLGFTCVALMRGEPVAMPHADAWWALGYLVVFGSLVAFTSFVSVIRLLPSSVVMTYAYVNPVVAVVLGWALLNEPITFWRYVGGALILISVAGIFRERRSRARVRSSAAGSTSG